MSVLFRGMKMPRSCDDCRFYVDGWCYACEPESEEEQKYTREGWCPFGKLPPHGRLIDADALINIINRSITEEERVFNSIKEDPIGKHRMWIDIMHDKRIVGILENAPTIIEAEEEEE